MAVHTWAPAGQTPVLRVPLTHDRVAAMGGLTRDGRLFLQTQDHASRSSDVVRFLRFLRFLRVLLRKIAGKLAELRVRQRLAATGQTVPDQVRKPTARPTMRWLFQCFEGIDLLHMQHPGGIRSTEVLRLSSVHRLVLHLLGPTYENRYLVLQDSAE